MREDNTEEKEGRYDKKEREREWEEKIGKRGGNEVIKVTEEKVVGKKRHLFRNEIEWIKLSSSMVNQITK